MRLCVYVYFDVAGNTECSVLLYDGRQNAALHGSAPNLTSNQPGYPTHSVGVAEHPLKFFLASENTGNLCKLAHIHPSSGVEVVLDYSGNVIRSSPTGKTPRT